jgi:hypothetical protein
MPEIRLHRSRTNIADPEQAAEALVNGIQGGEPRLVTLFASRDRDQRALNRAIRERLPKGVRLLGATTNGEVDNEGIHGGSAVLGALSGDFEVALGLGRGLTVDAAGAGAAAMRAACDEFGLRPQNVDTRRHVGLVIDDGLKAKKEELLLGALEKNQSLLLVGGGASDPNMRSAELHIDGAVETDAVLLALFRTDAPWAVLRSHPYHPVGTTFTITEVDDTGMRALTIDGKPAAPRFAELVGVPVQDLDFFNPNGFGTHSAALRVGREFFMRGPFKVHPDESIEFVNLLSEGATLELMRLGDMPGMTRDFFTKDLPRAVTNPQAALIFHCAGRDWLARLHGTHPELSASFAEAPPCVGFNVQFEIFCGFQINTTLTTLVFGKNA